MIVRSIRKEVKGNIVLKCLDGTEIERVVIMKYLGIITQVYKKWGHDCCWAAGGHFRSNFPRRIRIRGQNWPITSGC